MHQCPSIREASATGRIVVPDLQPNIEYILGLTNYNGIINNSSQHTIRSVCVNAQVLPMTS